MSVSNHVATALITAALLAATTVANAKGPQGVGPGASSSSSNSQGLGSNTWTQPPGWGNAQDTKGWTNSSGQPPGFDSPGKANGWNGDPLPPGLEKRQ